MEIRADHIFVTCMSWLFKRVNNAIHRINLYPVDNTILSARYLPSGQWFIRWIALISFLVTRTCSQVTDITVLNPQPRVLLVKRGASLLTRMRYCKQDKSNIFDYFAGLYEYMVIGISWCLFRSVPILCRPTDFLRSYFKVLPKCKFTL